MHVAVEEQISNEDDDAGGQTQEEEEDIRDTFVPVRDRIGRHFLLIQSWCVGVL